MSSSGSRCSGKNKPLTFTEAGHDSLWKIHHLFGVAYIDVLHVLGFPGLYLSGTGQVRAAYMHKTVVVLQVVLLQPLRGSAGNITVINNTENCRS